jgi:hypothetical protein
MSAAESGGGAPAERWVTGDIFGVRIPADLESMLDGGAIALTDALRAAGTLEAGGRVSAIVGSRPFVGGGTGTKAIVDVTYEGHGQALPEQLFVKFSRNFDSELQDRGRFMMASEARFAVLARRAFPVPVPRFVFADVEASSGTGLLVTARIPYGDDGVEPLHPKCLDHLLDDPAAHYAAILRGQARMAGAHRTGQLSPEFDVHFPYDPGMAVATVGALAPVETLERWAHRMFDFVERHPQLLPGDLVERTRFLHDIPRVLARRDRVLDLLGRLPESVGFSHWNANIDNCWFERDDAGDLVAGFIDWANAGPAPSFQAALGALSGAPATLWRDRLDDLLAGYVAELAATGAPRLDVDQLRQQVLVLHAMSSLGFAMGAPVAIEREIADLDALTGPADEQLLVHENARIQLHMMTNLLVNWETFGLGDLVAGLPDGA